MRMQEEQQQEKDSHKGGKILKKEQTKEELERNIKNLEKQFEAETRPSNKRFLKKAIRKNEQQLALKILGKG